MKKVLLTLFASIAFFGLTFAQGTSYWGDVNAHLFWNHDPVVAMVSLDNNLILSTDNYSDYEVGAFVEINGEEVFRGHGFIKYYGEFGDPYPIVEFEVYYKPLDNENELPLPVHFKMYDHSTGILYDYFTSEVSIVTQTMYNSYDFSQMPVLSFFHSFKKSITPYSEEGGYYFISSPIGEVMAKDVVNLRSNEIDFYSFDQMPSSGLEWVNHRDDEDYLLQPGMGFLYANSGDGTDNPVVLTFVGAPYDGDGIVTLEKKEGPTVEFPGWNLVGNPFAQTAYITKPFYTLDATGSEVVAGSGNEVGAMEGVFVIATEDNEQMTFSTTPIDSKGQIVLNLSQNHDKIIDRAIVRFGGDALPKFMLDESNTKLYISKNDNNFAVMRSSKSGKLPVNFEPSRDGVYTISGIVENMRNVKYLHLVDNQNGADIDLLRNPNYSFEAKTTDRADRFVLVFSTNFVIPTVFSKDDNDSFGFFNNGNWIINNEGDAVLQVIDVNGQILSNEEISGCISKHIEAAPGVYMLRLVNGNDVKVQKIVVE